MSQGSPLRMKMGLFSREDCPPFNFNQTRYITVAGGGGRELSVQGCAGSATSSVTMTQPVRSSAKQQTSSQSPLLSR